jgi:hypothetical protein
MDENRPPHCRERLKDEGKAYHKSSCSACGSLLIPDWKCPYANAATRVEGDRERLRITLRHAREALWPFREYSGARRMVDEIDKVLG